MSFTAAPGPSDSDVLDAALRSLDEIAEAMARSRHSRNPKPLNRWLMQFERELRHHNDRLRDARPYDPVQARIADRLSRMAQGYFG